MELLQLAFGNLLRARARFVMTAGGVLVGTAAVILLIALTIGLQNAAEAGIGSSTALTELTCGRRGTRTSPPTKRRSSRSRPCARSGRCLTWCWSSRQPTLTAAAR
ncbi:MAG: hypothetical protein HND48_16680 [Chloroflexi bacterium]|nr:hypothetical protein [Chloroflexota bacterium]